MSPRRLAARKACGRALAALAASAGLLLALAPAGASAAECPNEALRVGASAQLPECRAYEVLTPNIGALSSSSQIGTHDINNDMSTWFASPDGESVIFDSEGSIEEENSNGTADRYESVRTPQGWKLRFQGPSGAQASFLFLGGASPDHRFSFLKVGSSDGSLGLGNYLYERDGGLQLIGTGSLGTDLNAEGLWLTEGGRHVIFSTTSARHLTSAPAVQLEPNAPPSPIGAIYDRPVGGPTHVVSLLPDNLTPASDPSYLGSSNDGTAAVFAVNGTMYVRRDNTSTSAVAHLRPGDGLNCSASHLGLFAGSTHWLRNGVPITGASNTDYTIQPGDAGTAIQCQIQVPGSTVSTSVPPTLITTTEAPIAPPQLHFPLAAPSPADPTAGTVETCPSGEWSGSPTLAYQWYKSGEPIAGAMGATYEVQGADVPSTLQCSVTATNGDGSIVSFSAASQTDPPLNGAKAPPVVIVDGGTGFQGSLAFAGASSNGNRVFYARHAFQNGYEEFDAFDAQTDTTIKIADEGAVLPVQVSEDGSHAYFLSKAVLTGSETNSVGVSPVSGEENLYVWDGSTRYVATVSPDDLAAKTPPREPGAVAPDSNIYGLGFWISSLDPTVTGFAHNLARTNPSGSAIVFQSKANLVPGYDSQEHWEIFRYDASDGDLNCVSCNPDGIPATADAELETLSANISERKPANTYTIIPNITPDGEMVVFNTAERLLPEDEDDFYDVYRWREGELALISGGQSTEDSFLSGMSRDGRDIFFHSYDTLAPQDQDGGSRSIYDVRVDGGFPPALKGAICEGEGCQGGLPPAPLLAGASTPNFQGTGNVREASKKKHKKKKHAKKKRHAPKAKKGGKR